MLFAPSHDDTEQFVKFKIRVFVAKPELLISCHPNERQSAVFSLRRPPRQHPVPWETPKWADNLAGRGVDCPLNAETESGFCKIRAVWTVYWLSSDDTCVLNISFCKCLKVLDFDPTIDCWLVLLILWCSQCWALKLSSFFCLFILVSILQILDRRLNTKVALL